VALAIGPLQLGGDSEEFGANVVTRIPTFFSDVSPVKWDSRHRPIRSSSQSGAKGLTHIL
jgi:hypothetical protein